MSVSQAVISQQVGVSRTAVSHVLNGRGYMVSEETRKRIMTAVEANGYHRNALVRALKANRTHVIGIIVPEINVSFFAELIQAAETAASAHGLQCFLCQTRSKPEVIEKDVTTLREYRVDGMLIVPASGLAVPHVYRTLVQQKFPFVVADVPITGLKTPYVGNDNRLAGQLATEHLLSLGHRRIAAISGFNESPGAVDRLLGYQKALKKARIEFDPALVIGDTYDFKQAKAATAQLLKSGAKFTAVVASSDFAAFGAIQAVVRAGLRVPEDVSVVGCGNSDVSVMVTPALTTVDQNPTELGRAAIEILFNQIEGNVKTVRTAIVAPSLVVRGSTCAPK